MKKMISLFTVSILLALHCVCYGQSQENLETETLFSDNISIEHVTKPGMQINPIQNQLAGMIGLSSGWHVDKSLYVGIAGYANITHTKLNMGVLGVEVEQFYKPDKLAHAGYNIFAGVGAVKDYQSKNNLFDNFLNIFGTYFFFLQPSVKLEVNFTPATKFDIGIGYRFAAGLDEGSTEITRTKLMNRDLNHLIFFINFKMF